jgi:hypothetical protein
MEVGCFCEVEVNSQIFIFVLDGQIVVASLILWAFTKRYSLSADLDVRVASAGHHLDLQVIERLV